MKIIVIALLISILFFLYRNKKLPVKKGIRKYYLLIVIWTAIAILIRQAIHHSNYIYAAIALMAAATSVYIWKNLTPPSSDEQ